MYKVTDSLLEKDIKKRRSDSRFLLCVVIIAMVLFIISCLNTFVFFTVRVKGPSMNTTLFGGDYGKDNGDVLIVNKLKTPTHGDIVIIEGVESDWLIKRVIALEGDTVKIENGKVHLKKSGATEFTTLSEPYAQGQTKWTGHEGVELTLKANEVFYLGDNRERSSDSRESTKGVCKTSNVIGVVESWSLNIKGVLRVLYSIPDKIASLFKRA